ncbi:MAG: hypothetical protein WBC63_04365, partial [Candidatus Bipolaricaulia bacterium]
PYVVRSTLDGFFDATGSSRAPTPPPPEPEDGRGTSSTLTIILIAIGGAVALVGGTVGLVIFLRSRYYI